jgi:hypothetical protein
MSIPTSLFQHIMPFLEINDLGKLDNAFLNTNLRPEFLHLLQSQDTLIMRCSLLLDKHGFVKWLKKRQIHFRKLIFYNPSAFLFNSIICIQRETITDVVIKSGRIIKDSMGVMSLLCPNIKSFTYNNKQNAEDEIEIDCFYDVHTELLENLEFIHINRCSNYTLLLLTLYARRLQYIKIEETRTLNSGIFYDFLIVRHKKCKIDCELIWTINMNLLLIGQKEPGTIIENIEFNYDDIHFMNREKMQQMFEHHKNIKKMTISNVYDIENCKNLFQFVDTIKVLIINGVNMINIQGLLKVVEEKKIESFKITYVPTVINTCVSNLILFFLTIACGQYRYRTIDIVIDFRLNILNDDMIFEKFVELVNIIEVILDTNKVSVLRINYKMIHKGSNWKNDLYYHLIF